MNGDLVRLLDVDEEFIIDLKYAKDDNFTGKRVYDFDECYINQNTAKLLVKAKELFKQKGYSVKVFDAYRPLSAQKRFFEILPDPNFVAVPPDVSKLTAFRSTHWNGLCVDITLVDETGHEIPMPTAFDDFSEMAGLGCEKIPDNLRKNAEYMREVMESCGFRAEPAEWWHFYDNITVPPAYVDVLIV